MSVTMEATDAGGWSDSLRVSNGLIELVIPRAIGIRVMRLGFVGGANQFRELAADAGRSGEDQWRIYGGHRLWHAPETRARTYSHDNFPVVLEQRGDTLVVTQPTDHAGITKQIELTLAPDRAEVTVVHRLTNEGVWTVDLAVWGLSVMASGGTTIIPLPPRGDHRTDLHPNTFMNLWSYTRMSDPRWTWGDEYILLRQDANATVPQKIGLLNTAGWAAHWNDGVLFVKRAALIPNATYPDHGCSYEFFTNFEIMEVESLSPLTQLAPQQSVTHTETWQLWRDVPAIRHDADVQAHLLPLLADRP